MKLNFDDLVILLNNGIGQRRMYFSDHPKVVTCCRDFTARLKEVLRSSGKESFFLGVVEGKLVHDGRYLVGPTIVGRRLVDFAEALHSGGFLFSDKIEQYEVRELLSVAAEVTDPVGSLQEARSLLKARSITSIEISPVYEDPGWFGQFIYAGTETDGHEMAAGGDLDSLIPVYQSLYSTVETAHGNALRDHELDLNGARTVSEKLLRSTQGNFMDIMQLVRYPDYDSYTVGHSVRVAMIAMLVAHKLGLTDSPLLELGTAALMHDVGKAKIPEEILFKPGRLTDEERRIIERHPRLGAHILLQNSQTSLLAISAAWGHHFRHDGSGYPVQSPWAITSKFTSLLHVCDVFEALTAIRPYKQALTPRRAYEIMVLDRGAFDPAALIAFVSAMGLYPPGNRVLLSSGERGIVVAAGENLERPRVQITHDQQGQPLAAADTRTLDLAAEEARNLSVTRSLVSQPTDGEDQNRAPTPPSSTILECESVL